jgi:hypothetical protein
MWGDIKDELMVCQECAGIPLRVDSPRRVEGLSACSSHPKGSEAFISSPPLSATEIYHPVKE